MGTFKVENSPKCSHLTVPEVQSIILNYFANGFYTSITYQIYFRDRLRKFVNSELSVLFFRPGLTDPVNLIIKLSLLRFQLIQNVCTIMDAFA